MDTKTLSAGDVLRGRTIATAAPSPTNRGLGVPKDREHKNRTR